MPYVSGRYLPESITSVNRSTQSARVRLVINPDPNIVGPDKYTYQYETIQIGQQMKTRRMVQKSKPDNFFEFTYPPTQIAYEGMGIEFIEIPRPLLIPLVDIKQGRNYKAVFEFLVAEHLDGLNASVEQQLVPLEWMANSAEPVYFENFDTFLTNGFWYIAEFAIKTSRVNTNGEITAAQCSISLLEYRDTETQFVKFPKISYTNLTRRPGGGSSTTTSERNDLETDADSAGTTTNTNLGSKPTGTAPSTPATNEGLRYYRFSRTTEPNKNVETYASLWRKEGNRWVYYSKSPTFPAIMGSRIGRGFYQQVSESRTTGFVGSLKGQALINYQQIIADYNNLQKSGRVTGGGS